MEQEHEAQHEGQFTTFMTNLAVLTAQAIVVGLIGGVVATALFVIVRMGQ